MRSAASAEGTLSASANARDCATSMAGATDQRSGGMGNVLIPPTLPPPTAPTAILSYSAWYRITPQFSQASIVVPALMAERRLIGMAVLQAPQVAPLSATSTTDRLGVRSRS